MSRPGSTVPRTPTTFRQIILPLVTPILVVVGLLAFIALDQRIHHGQRLPDTGRQQDPRVGLFGLVAGERNANFGIFAAGTLLTAIPTVDPVLLDAGLHRRRPDVRRRQGLTVPGVLASPTRRRSGLASIHHDGSAALCRARRRGAARSPADRRQPSGSASGAGRDSLVERVLRADDARWRAGVRPSCARSSRGPACRWWEASVDPVDADDRLPLPGRDRRRPMVAQRHRAASSATDRRRRLRVVAGFDPPRGSRIGSSTRSFRTDSPTATRPTTSPTAPGRIGASRPADAPWGEPPRTGAAAMVEFFGGDLAGLESRLDHLGRPRGQRDLPDAGLRDAARTTATTSIDYEHVADHFGGDAALVVAAAGDPRPGHPADPRHRAEPRRASSTRGSRRPRPIERPPTDVGYFVFRRAPGRLRVVARRRLAAQARLPRDRTCATAMYDGPDGPCCAAGCDRRSRSTAGASTSPTCSAGSDRDQLGPEVARGMRAAVKAEDPDAYLHRRACLRRHRPPGRRPVGRRHELRRGFQRPVLDWLAGVERSSSHDAGSSSAPGRSTTEDMVADAERFPGGDPLGGRRASQLTTCSTATTRRAFGPAARRRRGTHPRRLRAAADLRRRAVRSLYGDEVGLRRRGRLTHASDDALGPGGLGPRAAGLRAHAVRHARPIRGARDAAVSRCSRPVDDSLAYLRDTDREQAIVVVVRGPEPATRRGARVAPRCGRRRYDLPRAAQRGARRRWPAVTSRSATTAPGAAVWTSDLDPNDDGR